MRVNLIEDSNTFILFFYISSNKFRQVAANFQRILLEVLINTKECKRRYSKSCLFV